MKTARNCSAALTLLLLSLFCATSPAVTTVNATLRDPSGNPLKFAYLQFDLQYCGYNVPAVPGGPLSMVSKSIKFTPSQLPATIYGNDEITCGNSYSTLWHVTAFLDSSTPIAGDANYVICSGNAGLSYCPNPSGSWNLAQAQPFTGNPPPPGFQSIFGNPNRSQTITQPTGTSFFWVGGTVDFTNTTVVGITQGGGGSGTVNPATQYSLPFYVNPGSSPFISGVAAPTTNGFWVPNFNVTGGVAVPPTLSLPGIPVNPQSGSYGLAYTDRGTHVRFSGGSTATLTLPAASGNLGANLPFNVGNFNSGALTITPTTPNNIDGGGGQASIVVPSKWAGFLYQDSGSPINWWSLIMPTLTAFPNCPDSGGNHLNFASNTFTCGTSGGGGGGGTPGGLTTQDQYNAAGSFAGKYNSTFASGTGETDTGNLGKEHIVTPFWNYFQSPADDLSVAGSGKTVTFTCSATAPCIGIDTTNNVNAQYTVYISTVGTPEVAPVTGGTCSLFATANCTVIVTTANAHAAGYTVGSATAGIQEAYNDAAKSGAGVRVKLMPFTGATSTYVVRSTVWIKSNKSILDGYGAQIQCFTRDRCISLGILTGGQIEDIVQGVEFFAGINVDGVNISSAKANTGRTTVTTSAAHPFVNNDWVIFSLTTPAITQEARVQVNTGASCVNGTAGAGACTATEFEYVLGASTFTASSGYGWANIENTAIEDIANHVRLQDVHIITGGSNRFSWGAVIGNDQASVVDGFSLASGTAIKCATSGFCGAGLYYRGDQGASPVAWITNSQISLGCGGGNGIRYAAGNGLHVERSVVQAFNEYGVYYKGGLQPWTAGPNFYEEAGACANFKYPQGGGAQIAQMGYFSGAPKLNIVDNTAIAGNFPSFPAQNVSTQHNNYFLVVISGGAVASPPLYIGTCLTSGIGTCTVYWPEPNLDINGGAAITYDLLEVTGTAIVPPYPGNAQSVATGITRGVACTASTGICSVVDPQSGYSAYTLNQQTITTQFNFWPAGIVLSNATKLESAGACGGGSIVTSTYFPSVACATNSSNSGTTAGTYSPMFEQTATSGTGSSGGASLRARQAGVGGLKGLIGQIDFNQVPQGDLYGFADSNYQKTLATPNHRPAADANDTALGFDNAQAAAANVAQLAFRAPVAISNYIGATFDGSSWLERLTASQKTYNIPGVYLQNVTALAGSFGFGPWNLSSSPVTNCLSGVGGNMTAINGVLSYASNVATFVSGSPALSVCTAVATANQSMQIQTVIVGAGSQGVELRASSTPGNFTRYLVKLTAVSWFIQKCNAANTCSTLASGVGTFTNGAHFLTGFVSGTTTSTITAYYDGTLLGTGTDGASPITSGFPGIEIGGIGAVGSAIAISQAYQSSADLTEQSNLAVQGNFTLPNQGIGEDLYTDLNHITKAKSGVCEAAARASGDICTDINWCYSGAGGSGVTSTRAGIIDARGYPVGSVQACNSNPFAGGNRSGLLLLGAYTIATSRTWVTPQHKMRILGIGGSSPLGANGNQVSSENTTIQPCLSAGSPAGCTAAFQQAANKIFVEPTYTATATNAAGTTAVFTTSTVHNYTFTSGSVASHILVTGCSDAHYNSGSFGNPAYFTAIAGTVNGGSNNGTTISVTLGSSGNAPAAGCTITEPPRQHGPFSATSSALLEAGDYYPLVAMGGQNGSSGYDGLGTCGTGPVGADWTLSGFGSTIEHVGFDNQGLAGVIGTYSGNEQERGGIMSVSYNDYGGTAVQIEGAGIMFDRNSYNLNDACSNNSGNGGPSHFTIHDLYCDAAPKNVQLTLTAAANASAGTTVYTGTITGGAANAFAGLTFTVAGFTSAAANNGTWVATASTATTLTLANTGGTAETHAGTAQVLQGKCLILAGVHQESDGSSVQDGASAGGLAQFGMNTGTIRGFNNGGVGKTDYGFWIKAYDDGLAENFHFENISRDPILIDGVTGSAAWTTQGWIFKSLDFASASGTNNAVVHFGPSTNNNRAMMIRGAAGSNPAGIRDEAFGCAGAFGAAPPCIVNGTVGGNPVLEYSQGGLQIPHKLQLGNTASPTNVEAGTGSPSGACQNGDMWRKQDAGAGNSSWTCRNAVWQANDPIPSQVLFVTSDFTTANNTNPQLITGLAFTFPALWAQNAAIDCTLMYSQATAAVSDLFLVQDVTVAPTQVNGYGRVQTAVGPPANYTDGNLTASSGTTSATVVTFTPGATATIYSADLHMMVEQPSNASTSAFQIQVKTTTGADAITIKRGSKCTVAFQ